MFLPLCALLALSVASPARPDSGRWVSLFDGKSLGGWVKTNFAAGGDARVEEKFPKDKGRSPAIVVEMGDTLSGVNWAPAEGSKERSIEIPRTNYEVALEFMKVDGNDFACGITFPVGDAYASLILGGWGGSTVGISSIDEKDASENETKKFIPFKKNQWYKVRLRVTSEKLEAWLDGKQVVDQSIVGRKIGLRRGEIINSVPLGIATFRTTAAYRNIRLRVLKK